MAPAGLPQILALALKLKPRWAARSVSIVGYAQMWLLGAHKATTPPKSATVIDMVYLGTTTLPTGDSTTQAFGLTTPVLLR